MKLIHGMLLVGAGLFTVIPQACAQGIEDISYFGYNGYKAKVTYICSPDTGIAKLQVNLIDQRVENKSWSGTLDTTCDGLPQEEVEVTLDATPTPLKDESGKADLFVELLFLKSDNSEVFRREGFSG